MQEALRDSEQNLLEHKERILRLERNSDSIVTDNREMKRIAEDKISKNQDYQEIIADLTEKLVKLHEIFECFNISK